MSFIKRNLWGLLLLVCFGFAVCAAFSTYETKFFWPSVIASLATLIAAIIAFLQPIEPRPFKNVYTHNDWNMGDGTQFPTLTIAASDHGMGLTPHLEFRQGDFVFPWHTEPNGDIVVVRDNHSIGRFKDLGITIRHKEP